ncbi:toprim domain-containing protein [Brotocaccenecus cirricatena]|jgi:DNA primase|nr:toprim domain-containing protein [Brotocaccenecus cirricatena]
MLEQVPQLDTILLCLDNDEAGHQASRRMREQLEMRYSVERLIPENKDWNDVLPLSGENAQGFAMNEMR